MPGSPDCEKYSRFFQETTVVSFAAGADYYFTQAKLLESDCLRLGVKYDIQRFPDLHMGWAELCRHKIKFFRDMHAKYGAILWTDVDNRIRRFPNSLRYSTMDYMGFAGRQRYIRNYNPYDTARFWNPTVLYFGNTEAAGRYLDLMAEIETEATESVTDDWILQEAWERHDFLMTIGIFPPTFLKRAHEEAHPDAVFEFGSSGNVTSNLKVVAQHQNASQDRELRSRILRNESRELMKAKDVTGALVLARRSVDVSPSNAESLIHLSKYLMIAKEHEESLRILETSLIDGVESLMLEEELGTRYKQIGELSHAQAIFQRIHSANRGSEFSARAESALFELEFDIRAAEQGIERSQRPRLWWPKTPYPGNFGHILSPWIVEKVSGKPPLFAHPSRSILGIGSIARFAKSSSVIWGAGTIRETDILNPEAKYRAVRGPLTQATALRSGADCPPIFGDPGMLLPMYYQPSRRVKHYKLGIVRSTTSKVSIEHSDDVLLISLSGAGEDKIKRTIDQICSCEMIISTSLYGLIVAHAYGIPAQLAFDSHTPALNDGDGTKFRDFFLSARIPEQVPVDLSNLTVYTSKLRDRVMAQPDPFFDPDALLSAFPSNL